MLSSLQLGSVAPFGVKNKAEKKFGPIFLFAAAPMCIQLNRNTPHEPPPPPTMCLAASKFVTFLYVPERIRDTVTPAVGRLLAQQKTR